MGGFTNKKLIKDYEELLENKRDMVNYWYPKYNPKVSQMEQTKKALLLTVGSMGDRYGDRGRVHTLLAGEPGTAKSKLGIWTAHQLDGRMCGKRTTDVGLTGSYDKKTGEIEPGALPQAHGNAIFIDELDEFAEKDRQGLLEAMSDGKVNIEVGGDKKQFEAQCRVIASVNDTSVLSPELKDRFDFVFELETPNKDEQQEIMNDRISDFMKETEGYEGSELRGYLDYIKSFQPEITRETRERLKDIVNFYISAVDEGETGIRHKESIIRIGIGIAKLNMRDLDPSDVVRATLLQDPSNSKNWRTAQNMANKTIKQIIHKALEIEGYT
ncbi:MAG: ATPase involved in replication control Cdc46/Mcm family [Candidatus Methanohalarchaeum thermophilum]|uniref:ATPase involved in replication control Cdc46/Mcm family n=1 Tax=Methanohalarchaeum thermophilum TaxID=1903181 RepID=A0A1Q6DWP8_METT1|nr:MAG: ATPase involved in replication control Cdc46/Mcm family [Candidatus Methanohalarchaeum thermophilum]